MTKRLYDVCNVMTRTGLTWGDILALERSGQFPARADKMGSAFPADEVDKWIAANPTPPKTCATRGETRLTGDGLAVFALFGWHVIPWPIIVDAVDRWRDSSK